MKRTRDLGLVAGALLAAGALCACTGDDTTNAVPPPPVNDAAAPDATMTIGSDGGDAATSTPEGGGMTDSPVTDDGGAPACSSLPGTVIYVESADTQEALLDTVGRQLRDKADITLVFLLTGSCTVTPDIYSEVAIPTNTDMLYIPSTAESPSWTPADPESTCTTGTSSPTPQFGIAALFPSSCAGYSTLPQGKIEQFIGPTQAYTFIVPNAEFTNGQTSISNEEAYYAFGDGVSNPVTIGNPPNDVPEWNDPTQFFLRPATKSTLVSTALNIQLTPTQMVDVGADGGTADGRQLLASSTDVLNGISTAVSGQAIGILGDEVYDQNRSKVSVLAYQDILHGQTAAYFPDSAQTGTFDKQNIRDGHYSLWSPDVYLAPATAGVPSDPNVKYVLDIILGNPNPTLPDGGSPAPIDGITVTASVGLTPSCAMQVTRSADGAPLTAYVPAAPCTCKFLSAVPGATDGGLPASCTPCTTAADCSDAGLVGCFNGYCETKPAPLAQEDGGTCDNASILNACTNAQAVTKTVSYPTDDGGLQPVSQ